jgi:hypothetical protein
MKHIKEYKYFNPEEGFYVDLSDIVQRYEGVKGDNVEVGIIDNIKIIAVNKEKLGIHRKEWRKYIGSHHWGKKTSYIPEDEIWISSGLDSKKFVRLIHHELIEREFMKKLINQGMSTLDAWKTAHYMVKSMGY